MTVLSVENLTVAIDDAKGAEVVRGISLEIAAGETVCLVGESGSGKSVTSLAAMGLLPKGSLKTTSGRILLDGEDLLTLRPNELRERRATRMSMIFQEPMTALNPVMKVGDQILEVLTAHTRMPSSEAEAKVTDILGQVGLPDIERMASSYPHQLSGGQRQRIMIAMALVLEPRLLIADEPTTALDVTTQKQILKLIKDLQTGHGTAVLFITHDMGVVAEIADRVYVMNQGALVEDGPVRDVMSNPTKDYTRKLLSSVPSLDPRAPRPPRSKKPTLVVSDLNKVYGGGGFLKRGAETHAVKDVSLELMSGRTLGVVGESGSGKSTLARCVMRMIDITSGGVKIGGQEIGQFGRRAMHPYRKRLQMVFQDPYRSLNPRLTVEQSIVEGPVNYGMPRKEARAKAAELLDLVGLPTNALGRYPHMFSGGQRQRIAVARALAMEPELLVADEAVSALDVSVQAQVLDLLDEIQDRTGIAILFITHDLRVAAQVCDEVAVMHRGRVVEMGTTRDVLGNPQHEYTQSLLAAAPGRDWDFANFRPVAA
ncbi:peptide/nickel transport system ATP-binding protein [Palleronia aestuarii]|uniref:Peptide/nickel transport system ATP-binding protein n=1 Tax=Palleronia aestuarii TaxID=568105 RepID=A0A2W7N9K3_9RHOB|nr:ABC transporter ATP-binding protein [Palleronia aestuarii]PZX17095.1 peptide/nickel transport system ATP-binding protein [Palleronia aestuarii]